MRLAEAIAVVCDGLKTGAWLTRRRMLEYAVILLVLEIAAFLFFAAGTSGLIVPLDRPNASDFVSFYAAGTLANAGTPELAYDAAVHYAAEQSVTEPGISYNYFYYPPIYLLLCAVIARLPYVPAFVAFETASLAFYVSVARRILGEYGREAIVLLLAFPAIFWNAGLGQNAFLTAALFGGGTLLLDRRPVLAGLVLGALCYKPHFGLLVPVALAAGRHWRSFTAAVFSLTALSALSLALFGWESWSDYLAAAVSSRSIYESGHVFNAGYASPFGLVLSLGGTPPLAYAVQGAVTIACACWVAFVWSRGLSLPIKAAALISATIVSVPVILFYDLMLGAVAMLWLVRAGRASGFLPWEKSLLALLFVLPAVSGHLWQTWNPMAAPIFAALLFATVAAAARHEIARSATMGKMAGAEA